MSKRTKKRARKMSQESDESLDSGEFKLEEDLDLVSDDASEEDAKIPAPDKDNIDDILENIDIEDFSDEEEARRIHKTKDQPKAKAPQVKEKHYDRFDTVLQAAEQ